MFSFFVFRNLFLQLIFINFLLNTNLVCSIEVKEDTDENSTDDPNDDFDHNPENTRININASLASPPEIQIKETSRITIPTNYYNNQILSSTDDRDNISTSASTPSTIITQLNNNVSTFNPSPQVFEYNTYPVLPAYPEAKHVQSELFNTINLRTYLPPAPVPMTYSTPRTSEYLPPKLPSSSGSLKPYSGGVGTWFSSVGSPESKNPVTVKDQSPYPFHFGGGNTELTRPTVFGNSRPVRPPQSSYLPSGNHKEHGMSPWKKVIHFITALLPIGLFLTALTPTVLTVMPGNVNNDSTNLKTTRLLDVDNTLIELLEGRVEDTSGCYQTKLLCEAASKGRDPGATNLQKSLWLIASQSYEETKGPKEFLKLFYAIKGNRCHELKCNYDDKLKS